MAAFIEELNRTNGTQITDSDGLYEFSIEESALFWSTLGDSSLFDSAVSARGNAPAIVPARHIRDARWFPGATANVAEIMLRGSQDHVAIIEHSERGRVRQLTRGDLAAQVAAAAAAMSEAGVSQGDRVAAWAPNVAETVVFMLAAASLGAVFSSTSPDFGTDGVIDRFAQIEPRLLLAASAYYYGGTRFDCTGRLQEIRAALPSVELTIVIPAVGDDSARAEFHGRSIVSWREWLMPHRQANSAPCVPVGFRDPLYVLYSSGTTGPPKAIIHSGLGVTLKHIAEHRLQCDIRPGDRVFWFTTCGWMMWNWLVGSLASGATIILYDGSPFHPGPEVLWELADQHQITHFGVSAKYLDALAKAEYSPAGHHDLKAMRMLGSTGSPLSPDRYEWVYEHVASDLHLASISGGTDICGCFVAGDPTQPVFAGEIQRPALAMAVDVVDEEGESLDPGQFGELVCRNAFPSVPLGFWGDDDGQRFNAAYFDTYPGMWHHGDFASCTTHGGLIISGRSDTTLNPGGVRIGTAEIYRQVEQLEEIIEACVAGQPHDGDTRIVLFVILQPNVRLDDGLMARIRARIRAGCTPRHVPAVIAQVRDLPRTRSGKLAELAVADVLAGRPVRNTAALANDGSLDELRLTIAEFDS